MGLIHRTASAISRRLNFTYKVRHGINKGMRRKGGLGWLPWGEAESEEVRFLRSLDLRGKVVYDIGGYEGFLTMFFASQASKVIVYEPNPVNRGKLVANISLNGLQNVVVRDVGLSSDPGQGVMVYQAAESGAGSLSPAIAASIARSADAERTEVTLRTLDQELDAGYPRPDFIKIDVEGLEHDVLRGAKRTLSLNPDLYIEIHGTDAADGAANARRVVAMLADLGCEIRDVERDVEISPVGNWATPFHIFARARRA